MQSKRCFKCRETKTLEEFHRNRSKCDGLASECKECCRASSRDYYEAHREEQLARHLAYREANREEISAYSRAYHEAHRVERNAYSRAYYEDHREECNAQIRNRETEARKASREVATRNGEPWTPAEDHVVLTSEGTVLEIAIELGRTTRSVNGRRTRLRRKAVTA